MSKKNTAWLVVAGVAVVALGIWIGILLSGSAGGNGGSNPDGASPYSAVYLTTGDVYFGKLSWFPSPHLTDVWFLQRTENASGQAQVGIVPFTSVFWSPVDSVNLDRKQIVFWTNLKNGSQLVQAMENPTQATEQPQGVPVGGVQLASSTPSGDE